MIPLRIKLTRYLQREILYFLHINHSGTHPLSLASAGEILKVFDAGELG